MDDLHQKEWPKVTVIIVNWNGEQFIERCLTALMEQSVLPHQIILVDNASSDGSLEIVKRFPSVHLMPVDWNAGFATGNNLALKDISDESEWIALINPDAFALPNWLEELLISAESNSGFDIFGSKLINAEFPSLMDGAGDAYHMSGLVWRMAHGSEVSDEAEGVCEVFSPCAAAALYSRSAWQKVGGFDEDYFCYVEDVDMGFRLRLAGYRCLYVPQSIALHFGSGTTGGQHSDFSVYHGHRNLVWTFIKNMPGVMFWMLLPLHLILNVLTVVWFVSRGRARLILRAKYHALQGIPKMWKKRQEIQRNRLVSFVDIWHLFDKRLLRGISKLKRIQ